MVYKDREDSLAYDRWYRTVHGDRRRAAQRRSMLAKRLGIPRRLLQTHEEMLAVRRAWRATKRDAVATWNARRRASRYNNGGHHTLTEWLEKCSLFANLCAYCGEAKKLERDHKRALSLGGTDDIGNILPACHSCNSSKKAMTPIEFIAKARR